MIEGLMVLGFGLLVVVLAIWLRERMDNYSKMWDEDHEDWW